MKKGKLRYTTEIKKKTLGDDWESFKESMSRRRDAC